MKLPDNIFEKAKEWLSINTENTDIPANLQRKKGLRMPSLSEIEVVRHYTYLSTLNYGVDTGFYPLGSCTMKYNPKVCEKIAALPGFLNAHPNQDDESVQGILEIIFKTDKILSDLMGYSAFTFQPAAGSHGEHTGLLIIRAYLESRGDSDRNIVLVPDTAHGTNPASAAVSGFKVRAIPSDDEGNVDLDALKSAVSEYKVAALMLTNPSTLGLFESNILEISKIVHDAGGLLYYDGANANALLGFMRPGDMGFDVCHLNLHKSFATPHGGGGPGSGPVGVKDFLVPFLPKPLVFLDEEGQYYLDMSLEKSIGRVHGFHGNINVVIKALVYIYSLGIDGLKSVSKQAILNANYLKKRLSENYMIPYNRACMHEFVISVAREKADKGVSAIDIAKRLIDYGIHPPTIYFPLNVPECLMIEPTETETKATLDEFIEIMEKIKVEIDTNPGLLKNAPYNTVVRRLDEAMAVKKPKLTYFDDSNFR